MEWIPFRCASQRQGDHLEGQQPGMGGGSFLICSLGEDCPIYSVMAVSRKGAGWRRKVLAPSQTRTHSLNFCTRASRASPGRMPKALL